MRVRRPMSSVSLDANGNPVATGIGSQPTFGSPGAFTAWSILNARDLSADEADPGPAVLAGGG